MSGVGTDIGERVGAIDEDKVHAAEIRLVRERGRISKELVDFFCRPSPCEAGAGGWLFDVWFVLRQHRERRLAHGGPWEGGGATHRPLKAVSRRVPRGPPRRPR